MIRPRNSRRSQFMWQALLIGAITGAMTVMFNDSAYTLEGSKVILHPLIILGAAVIVTLFGVFSRPLTQSRAGILLTSMTIGAMIGIIIVGATYHWGFGLLTTIPMIVGWVGRKLYYTEKYKYHPQDLT